MVTLLYYERQRRRDFQRSLTLSLAPYFPEGAVDEQRQRRQQQTHRDGTRHSRTDKRAQVSPRYIYRVTIWELLT